ncbi:hypothetical protein ACFV2D_26500 [Streptomyces capillispiralis]|uniref:hypothetical protein n=1 Tax=Streptomyces capillispiralis TaxID=68182 RepID=UPI0036853E76
MDRLLHHELRAVFAALAVAAVCGVGRGLVHGFSVPSDAGDLTTLFVTLCMASALWTLLGATRLKWVSEVRDFERAVPVEDIGVVPPAGRSLRGDWFRPGFFAGYLAFTLPLALLWEAAVFLAPLWSALNWLGKAALISHWEHRHGLLLWRGHVGGEPWRLSVSRRTPAPADTGEPPA